MQLRSNALIKKVLSHHLSEIDEAAVLNSRQGGSNTVLLTLLGGGVFGNAPGWIHTAIKRALELTQGHGLDVRLVSYGTPSAQMRSLSSVNEVRQ